MWWQLHLLWSLSRQPAAPEESGSPPSLFAHPADRLPSSKSGRKVTWHQPHSQSVEIFLHVGSFLWPLYPVNNDSEWRIFHGHNGSFLYFHYFHIFKVAWLEALDTLRGDVVVVVLATIHANESRIRHFSSWAPLNSMAITWEGPASSNASKNLNSMSHKLYCNSIRHYVSVWTQADLFTGCISGYFSKQQQMLL